MGSAREAAFKMLERLGIRKMKTAPIVTVRQINGSI